MPHANRLIKLKMEEREEEKGEQPFPRAVFSRQDEDALV